jgi:hypothetical protein
MSVILAWATAFSLGVLSRSLAGNEPFYKLTASPLASMIRR